MRYPSPEEWPKLIAEFRESGLTQKEFVAKHDIPHSTFQYWLYVRGKRLSTDSKLSRKFLPMEVVASPALKARAAAGLIEATLASGVVIRFGVGTDARYIAQLLSSLQ
jgi:hypothetical protein